MEYNLGGSMEPKLKMRIVGDDRSKRKTFLESTLEPYILTKENWLNFMILELSPWSDKNALTKRLFVVLSYGYVH